MLVIRSNIYTVVKLYTSQNKVAADIIKLQKKTIRSLIPSQSLYIRPYNHCNNSNSDTLLISS